MRDESIHRVPRARFHSFCNHLVGFRNDAGWTKTHGRYLPDETTDIVRKLQAQARQQFVRGYLCALTHAGLADKATAIDFLKREYLNHDDIDAPSIRGNLMFDLLHGDPRSKRSWTKRRRQSSTVRPGWSLTTSILTLRPTSLKPKRTSDPHSAEIIRGFGVFRGPLYVRRKTLALSSRDIQVIRGLP